MLGRGPGRPTGRAAVARAARARQIEQARVAAAEEADPHRAASAAEGAEALPEALSYPPSAPAGGDALMVDAPTPAEVNPDATGAGEGGCFRLRLPSAPLKRKSAEDPKYELSQATSLSEDSWSDVMMSPPPPPPRRRSVRGELVPEEPAAERPSRLRRAPSRLDPGAGPARLSASLLDAAAAAAELAVMVIAEEAVEAVEHAGATPLPPPPLAPLLLLPPPLPPPPPPLPTLQPVLYPSLIPPVGENSEAHEAYMLSLITGTPFWRNVDATMAQWNANCRAYLNPFTFDVTMAEEENPEQTCTGMMMCAFCGVVALGSPLSHLGVRRQSEQGGAVEMKYMRAGDGVAPAAAAMPWLEALVWAKNVRLRPAAPPAVAEADEEAGADAPAAADVDDAEARWAAPRAARAGARAAEPGGRTGDREESSADDEAVWLAPRAATQRITRAAARCAEGTGARADEPGPNGVEGMHARGAGENGAIAADAGAAPAPRAPRRLQDSRAAAARRRSEALRAAVDAVPCWNVCSHCFKSSATRKVRQSYLVQFTREYAETLHSVSFSPNLHRLSVVDVRPQVQRLYQGVGRGVMVPGSLTSGILVLWNPDAATLSGDSDAPALQWLMDEMVARDSPVLRKYMCLFELPNSGGPGIVVLPPGAISSIVRRVRARDMRVGVPSVEQLMETEEAEVTAEAEAARRRDLMTLDGVGLTIEHSVPAFTAHTKLFTCGTAVLRPGPWLSPDAQRTVQIQTTSDGVGSELSLELAMFTYLFMDGVGFYDNRRADGAPPLSLVEYLKMRMQGMFTPFTMTGSYVLFTYQLRQAHLLIQSTAETTLASELRRVTAAREALQEEDDGGQAAWHSVLKWKLSLTLPGTPSFFRRKLSEVRAMTASLGLADFIVTLTQDDNTSTRWPEIDTMEQLEGMYMRDPGNGSFRDTPVEAARLFYARFWAWFNWFVLDKNGPRIYGNVVAWVVRFESQHRGSIHCHILIWVKPEDRARVTSEIIAFLPPKRADEHPQIARLRDILETKNTHTCFGGLCRPQGWTGPCGDVSPECRCKKHFPFAANWGQSYEDPIGRHWVMYRPGNQYMWISTTTAATAVSWNGHTNVQPLTTDRFTEYMMKYELKADSTGMLKLDCDVEKALGITGLSDHQKALISAATLTKPVSISDAAWNLLEYEIVKKSVKVHFINTRPTARLTTCAWPMRGGDQIRTSAASVPPSRIHEARPPVAELETMTIYEMFRKFEVKEKASIRGRERVGSSGKWHWYRVPADELYIASFWDPYPANDPEGFFYTILLRNVPFRNESDLTLPGETYLDACRHLPARDGVERAINSRAQLLKAIEEYWVLTHPTDCAEEICDKILDAMCLDDDLRVLGGPAADARAASAAAAAAVHYAAIARGEDPLLAIAAADEERRRLLCCEEARELADELDELRARHALDDNYVPFEPTQRRFVELVTAQGATGLVWLDGGPGTGKSLATKCALQILCQRAMSLSKADSGVHVTASSAKAARRLSRFAETTHKGFFIPTKGPILAANGAHAWYQKARRARVFFLEEYSMMSITHVASILQRLRIVFGCDTDAELFQRILFVLVGDKAQLPPVCFHDRGKLAARPPQDAAGGAALPQQAAPAVCKKCHLAFGYLFPQGEHVNLTTVHRFSGDMEWLLFLNIIRVRQPTQEEIDRVLGPLFIDKADAHAWVDKDTTVIVSHHVQREDWSERLYEDAVARGEAGPPEETPMHTSGRDIQTLQAWVDAPKFHFLRRVSVGMRIVCLANLSEERGALNGSQGVVERLNRNASGMVERITARMDDSGELFDFSRSVSDAKLSCSGLHPVWNYKKTFPLMPGYAITGHASQGATITGKVLVDMMDCFAPGLLYVMLSRVPRRYDDQGQPLLRIVGRLTPADFVPLSFDA